MRPFRLASRFSQTPLFEIDLPWMLAERDLVVSGLQAEVSLCADMRSQPTSQPMMWP